MGANCESMHPQQQSHEIQFATDCTITAALVGNVSDLALIDYPKKFYLLLLLLVFFFFFELH